MKKELPAFLAGKGGNKIAKGEEPGGDKSKKLPPPKFGRPKKTGIALKKGDKN